MSRKTSVISSLLGVLTSFLAVLGMISCCAFPLLAASLAWFGVGASQLSFFAEYQNLFRITAIVALCFGFYIVYFKKSKNPISNSTGCCTPTAGEDSKNCCDSSSSRSNGFAKIMLWIGVLAIAASFFMKNTSTEVPAEEIQCCPAAQKEVCD